MKPRRILAMLRVAVICLLGVMSSLATSPAQANQTVDCIAGIAKATTGAVELQAAADFFSHAENIPCVGLLSDPTGQFQIIVEIGRAHV